MLYVSRAKEFNSVSLRHQLMSINDWQRYDNPFESKWIAKLAYNPLDHEMLDYARNAYKIPDLYSDPYWSAAFKYERGDYLAPHLDAGVHPISGDRKAVTVLLYLSTDHLLGGDLVYKGDTTIYCACGTLVMFQNTDDAWHGNGPVLHGTRYVLTTSFLSKSHEGYTNFRKHAYFEATPELEELRDRRAGDQAAEVYQV